MRLPGVAERGLEGRRREAQVGDEFGVRTRLAIIRLPGGRVKKFFDERQIELQ